MTSCPPSRGRSRRRAIARQFYTRWRNVLRVRCGACRWSRSVPGRGRGLRVSSPPRRAVADDTAEVPGAPRWSPGPQGRPARSGRGRPARYRRLRPPTQKRPPQCGTTGRGASSRHGQAQPPVGAAAGPGPGPAVSFPSIVPSASFSMCRSLHRFLRWSSATVWSIRNTM